MKPNFSFQIYSSVNNLPDEWDSLSKNNIFLSSYYLVILEKAAPINMQCYFIGIFKDNKLVGISLAQYINLSKVNSLGDRDHRFKTIIKNFLFKRFISKVLVIGNNMLTGQNCYSFSSEIEVKDGIEALHGAANVLTAQLKAQNNKINLTVYKDFLTTNDHFFKTSDFKPFYQFNIQPNMVFAIKSSWQSMDDYIGDLNKKYRDQYKRARKKASGIEKRKLSLDEVKSLHNRINELYLNVAQNAPFNTFYLSENHFEIFKEKLHDNFLFYGYFLNEELIGFNTLIKNGDDIDTYFLGYDEGYQREKMLYLNMLYDMIGYSINKKYKRIIFARTALEIKSSVGAIPVAMFGLIKHQNYFINLLMAKSFIYFEPKTIWQQRNPFKEVL
ncbi:peptidogalycan biosysnthesis protein [Flavobacterium algicola]|uniref:peptidogalycan biosysnthesis protein n=1 Tax=Flavobacterium algicola TaxID=556529 RepID=UPI001EFC5EA3|nr:peptidogalycan biosysnthesis protein [Flavobacterium algicola]MCG9791315.1 peptidogalycan biosysnthesis protein [Flavobacterium algicola]